MGTGLSKGKEEQERRRSWRRVGMVGTAHSKGIVKQKVRGKGEMGGHWSQIREGGTREKGKGEKG